MGELVHDLQELARLHEAGVLDDSEFLQAKQARIAKETQQATSGRPLPGASGPREIAEIKLVCIESRSVARSTWRYVAAATGPRGSYEAARTPDFKAYADYWAYEYFPRQCPERTQAFDYIVQTLYGDGWEQLPYEGEHWWSKRFQRVAGQSHGSQRDAQKAPSDFSRFGPPDRSFSVDVPATWVFSHKHENLIYDRWMWEGQKAGEYRPNLVIARRSPGLRNFALEAYTKQVLKLYRRKDPPVDVTVAGLPAKRLPYYVVPGKNLAYDLIALVSQSTAWQLALNCPPDEHDAYLPAFERLVASFRI